MKKETFSLLSIGHRGVGKTVFLAGSYAELHSESQIDRTQQLWFDCQDNQVQENIQSILSFVVQTGEYPPPTLKITNFNFSLKRHSVLGAQTLCHFRWWDLPGESCNIEHPDFKSMVATSHGCCVFIDAYALVHKKGYIQALEDIIITPVAAIANLVNVNGLKYPFALILTKCDLLEPGPLSLWQFNERLQPLTTRLDAVKANYQTFYSFIPIVATEGASSLTPKGPAAPLLWLVWEISKAHNPGLIKNPLDLVTPMLPSSSQPGQELADGGLQSLFKPAGTSRFKQKLALYLFPITRKSILLLTLAIAGSVGIISPLFVDYERFSPNQPKHLDAMKNLATQKRRQQLDQSISLKEKLVQQQPERLELRLQLAHLYKLTDQLTRAETAYDQVLAQQKNNFDALVGKAVLRRAAGDTKTAAALFRQAEKAAPTHLKAQVRGVAQKTLQSPAKPMPPSD